MLRLCSTWRGMDSTGPSVMSSAERLTTVRSFVGYRRYDTEPEYRILANLMPLISTKHNYFMPTMKLIKKTRIGGKVRKKYKIDMPLNRVLNAPETQVSAEKNKRCVNIKHRCLT